MARRNKQVLPEIEEDEIDIISKSQLKREATHLQELGKTLAELKADVLESMNITDDLLEAFAEHKRLTQREAKRRHLQYIGKLMREVDAEALEQELEKQTSGSDAQQKHLHLVERWRDQLIEEDAQLTRFMDEYDNADVQHARQLIRNARKDIKENKNRGHKKKLFQWLKETIPF
jgi:ribosome-associated protein